MTFPKLSLDDLNHVCINALTYKHYSTVPSNHFQPYIYFAKDSIIRMSKVAEISVGKDHIADTTNGFRL